MRLRVIGRRDRLGPSLREAIAAAEADTAGGASLTLRVAVDYSARDAILAAALALPPGTADREALAAALGASDVDLLIRTGGERRLSDFLLWECAYAELRFVDAPWPEFDAVSLAEAMADLRARDRRFGALPAAVGRPARAA